ncbi:antibiotic biosynthesis monooxygenase [Ornithinibacillus gellani]|nr:antibiotic biosynthesis monooxygenase [Ornithinibacillus gellani]
MNVYMTGGTIDFLIKIKEKHPSLDFHFMTSGANAVAYYENATKNVFSSGRAYEALYTSGSLQDKGFVMMNNVPVADDGRTIFEDRYRDRNQVIENVPGFQAFRFLRPKKNNTYVILTQWATEQDYENWKGSHAYQQIFQDLSAKPPAYFLERPFIATYHMYSTDEA